jgi:hypothetical protein
MHEYENVRRLVYGDGAHFVPVCENCYRFVKADETVGFTHLGERVADEPNATCFKCGRVKMLFEGFY